MSFTLFVFVGVGVGLGSIIRHTIVNRTITAEIRSCAISIALNLCAIREGIGISTIPPIVTSIQYNLFVFVSVFYIKVISIFPVAVLQTVPTILGIFPVSRTFFISVGIFSCDCHRNTCIAAICKLVPQIRVCCPIVTKLIVLSIGFAGIRCKFILGHFICHRAGLVQNQNNVRRNIFVD